MTCDVFQGLLLAPLGLIAWEQERFICHTFTAKQSAHNSLHQERKESARVLREEMHPFLKDVRDAFFTTEYQY